MPSKMNYTAFNWGENVGATTGQHTEETHLHGNSYTYIRTLCTLHHTHLHMHHTRIHMYTCTHSHVCMHVCTYTLLPHIPTHTTTSHTHSHYHFMHPHPHYNHTHPLTHTHLSPSQCPHHWLPIPQYIPLHLWPIGACKQWHHKPSKLFMHKCHRYSCNLLWQATP